MSDYIYRYTRQDAIETGVLIPIDEWARNCGFKLPCCINERLFNTFPEETRQMDIERLLTTFYFQIAASDKKDDRVYQNVKGEKVVLHIGPGDEGEPVLTLCHLSEL